MLLLYNACQHYLDELYIKGAQVANTSPARESPVMDYPGASPEQSSWQNSTRKWRYSRKTAERLNNITMRTFYLFVLKGARYEERTRGFLNPSDAQPRKPYANHKYIKVSASHLSL